MKTRIEDICIWILTKLNYQRLDGLIINTTTKLSIKRIVPKDGKWHRVDWAVGFWIKQDKKIKRYEDIIVYKDGETVVNYKLNNL